MGKTTDEALARLEHKLDLALNFIVMMFNKGSHLPPMGDDSHVCPVCKQGVKYIVDMQDKSVSRQCGCKTGKFAPLDLEQFAPPPAAGGKRDAQDDVRGSTDFYGDTGSGGGRGPKGQPR